MKMVTTLVAAALLMTSAAFADGAKLDVTAIRSNQVDIVKASQARALTLMNQAIDKTQFLSQAKQHEGGWSVDIKSGKGLTTTGQTIFGTGLSAWVVRRGFPLYALSENIKVPVRVLIAVGGAMWIGGYAQERTGTVEIRMSEGEMLKAVRDLELIESQIQAERAFVMSQAPTLGVAINNKVTTWDGVKLPEALRQLGGTASNLNINRD